MATYRGRLAPTPTGFLHLGHARTFALAHDRARAAGGVLVLRDEDLDRDRCRPEFAQAMLDDLRWLGLSWDEGPDVGGPHAPYRQSERMAIYRDAFRALAAQGLIYPSAQSRKDVQRAVRAPQEGDPTDDEPVFPPELRPARGTGQGAEEPGLVAWRFRVPDGRRMEFVDGRCGPVAGVAGRDFGDFVVWRKQGGPAYELAVVVDDIAMGITEVVRGEDLLRSTLRQLLVYEALASPPPAFHHADLVRDAQGRRLAKREDALSLRALQRDGSPPADVRRLCQIDDAAP